MKRILALFFAATLLAAMPALAQKQYKVVDTVKLGGEGGWDYLYYDKDGQRLFITRGSHVMVVDAKTLKVTGDIPDLSGIHGVALAPSLDRGFISNGGDNTVTIFDLKTLKKLDSVKVGERPDAILYDPFTKHVFTFNARSKDSSVVDATSGNVVGTIPLGGKPEFPVTDGKGKLYANIEDKSEIAEIDAAKLYRLESLVTESVPGTQRLGVRCGASSPLRRMRQQDDGSGGLRHRKSRHHCSHRSGS